jgi:glutathione synthase/RimK-type ligase-like ATP-grasp enzyme
VLKDYELRVTVMGEHVLAVKIRSQETTEGRLDWRRAYDGLAMEPYSLSPAVADHCRQLVRRLGLVFGCLDFIVTPAGEYVFLEVNEMGQFLFVERYTGLPLLDAFCEFLLQGRVDFDWRPEEASLRYMDFETEIEEFARTQVKPNEAQEEAGA